MKRFLVAIPTQDGGVELYPMKEWLRQHASEVPQGYDATASTAPVVPDVTLFEYELRFELQEAGALPGRPSVLAADGGREGDAPAPR